VITVHIDMRRRYERRWPADPARSARVRRAVRLATAEAVTRVRTCSDASAAASCCSARAACGLPPVLVPVPSDAGNFGNCGRTEKGRSPVGRAGSGHGCTCWRTPLQQPERPPTPRAPAFYAVNHRLRLRGTARRHDCRSALATLLREPESVRDCAGVQPKRLYRGLFQRATTRRGWRRLRTRPREGLSGPRVNIQPEPGSTPGCEALRNLWRGRRTGGRRHPRQWLLRYEIRARSRVAD